MTPWRGPGRGGERPPQLPEESDSGTVIESDHIRGDEDTGVVHVQKVSKTGKPLGGFDLNPRKLKRQAAAFSVLFAAVSSVGGYIGGFQRASDGMDEMRRPLDAHMRRIEALEAQVGKAIEGQRLLEGELKAMREQGTEILRSMRPRARRAHQEER